jgi:pteridine reductase
MELLGKNILVTGGAVRIGKLFCLALAKQGANVFIHYGTSKESALETKEKIESFGVEARIFQADLSDTDSAINLIAKVNKFGPLFGLVNNASIFGNHTIEDTTKESWQKHFDVNLTAPFFLSKAFYASLSEKSDGRIVNIVDWRATRPSEDHIAYTISKAGLNALTKSLAVTMAPNVTVNAIAFGAILPPADGGDTSNILNLVPAGRWAYQEEIGQTLVYLMGGPSYITGETIHVDGGRHLV